MERLYGKLSLEKLGGAFNCKKETLQIPEKRASIAKQIRKLADCMDEVVRILTKELPSI